MNDEIKEIYLSNLEWTKTHDNMGGVMGNIVFKNNISYEEYQKLFKSGYFVLCDKDYIINLQNENEELKQDNIIGCKKFIKQRLEYVSPVDYIIELENKIEILQQENETKTIKLNAIRKYLLNNKLYTLKYDDEELFEVVTDKKAKDVLLNILNGGDDK